MHKYFFKVIHIHASVAYVSRGAVFKTKYGNGTSTQNGLGNIELSDRMGNNEK